MPKPVANQTNFTGGISFSEKEGGANSYDFGRAIDHRSKPKQLTLNPKSQLDSGSIVKDLPMWGARACSRTFAYGNTGNIYQNESDAWSLVHTASDSVGNGLEFFNQDKALYYTQNTTFGRLLDACTASTFYDDFKGSEGGTPTNTKSIDFEATSSMYASRADTASLSITSDLTLEAYIKPESLPADTDTMTLISKWDENGNLRSYKMDIKPVSNFFGDGSDGALTIATNTTETVIDANCTGTSGTNTLTVSNVTGSFATGQKIVIHQTRGTNTGLKQLTSIANVSGSTITTEDQLTFSPVHSATTTVANKAQVRVLKQHTNVTINAGITYQCKIWDGLKGGIIGWYANGTYTNNGTIRSQDSGFRGADAVTGTKTHGKQGEGSGGIGNSTVSPASSDNSNGSGAGGGEADTDEPTGAQGTGGGAGGGVETGARGDGSPVDDNNVATTKGGYGGVGIGDNNLSLMSLGGGGGSGGTDDTVSGTSGTGGRGAGIMFIFATTIANAGTANSNGSTGGSTTNPPTYFGSYAGGGGGGGAGPILYKAQTAVLGSGSTATGGIGGTGQSGVTGGVGGNGIVHIDYYTSYTGSATPTLTFTQDDALGSSDGHALRLQISSNGTNVESYTQEITSDISVGTWARWVISWEDTTSTANFYKNGTLLGTKTGSLTSIHDNASVFTIGADFDTTAQNFYDGLMDDTRVWNDVRTASELVNKNDKILLGTEANLVAYYEFEDDVTDSQSSGLNDLTAFNTPTYSEDIPFSGVTTRADEDQKNDQTGQTYTLTTGIDEGATHRQTFVPEKDPQESIQLDIGAVGTGNWTLTVHDTLNREVAALTVATAELHTGLYEFIFASVWRPQIGVSYHFHVTSTVADGTVVTGTTADLETARFFSYYQFLVSDKYHPIKEMLDFLVMGNERYLAKFTAGDDFDPHKLTFPSGYRVRALAYWREFIAIGCWKGTNITDFDDGIVFFWDGIKDTYNNFIKIPEGGVNAMFGTQDVLFISAGYSGEILIYTGGGSAQKFNKIPKIERDKYVELAPGSMNMWRSMIQMGVNLNTDSTSVHQGVYTIGTAHRQYPTSLGFDYPTSLGDQASTSVKVSMIYPSGQSLYSGWQNSNAFGIDKISVDNDVYDSGTVELLITDFSKISKEKYPLILRADFKPLVSSQSIRVKYKLDRESDWKTASYEDTVGAMKTRFRIKKRCKELQVAVDLKTTIATSPVLLGVTVEVEDEQRSRKNA